ncbi:hypothetical protein QOZ80_6AG0530650 [Eleusine coracana subsp. coracana]|nr:hypothetical protein QOZ80_6AG0530650 [Eleusine coracana subsp. coracana]
MAACVVINVKDGEMTARQLENEFKTLAGPSSTWRWYAKRITDKQFQMRFPTEKKVDEAAHFREMRLRTVPSVVIKIQKWSSCMGSKGVADEAWFRVRGIPVEKRSIPNVCWVGSLVGLTLEVDENNLKKWDFVRLKIGCRDATKVPTIVEGMLGLHFYDFSFQREVL